MEIKTNIALENNPANFSLFEVFYLQICKPTLNPQEECSELVDLLFQ